MKCGHDDYEVLAGLMLVEMSPNVNKFVLEVGLTCSVCKQSFKFVGVPHAIGRTDGPCVNADRTMLSLVMDEPETREDTQTRIRRMS